MNKKIQDLTLSLLLKYSKQSKKINQRTLCNHVKLNVNVILT